MPTNLSEFVRLKRKATQNTKHLTRVEGVTTCYGHERSATEPKNISSVVAEPVSQNSSELGPQDAVSAMRNKIPFEEAICEWR